MGKRNLIIFLLIIIMVNIPINAQLINSSFENWDVLGNPVNWYTSNLPGIDKTINQSSDAQDGIASVRIDVIEVDGEAFPGSLQSLDDVNQFGHPITERYESLRGYYKFSPQSSALLAITVSIYGEGFNLIGVGGLNVESSSNTWIQFNIPMTYFLSSDAASTVVSISISDTAELGFNSDIVGSFALIDNFSFQNPTHVGKDKIMQDFVILNQNYPNPFNPSTIIKYSIPQPSNITLKVFDVLGSEVATLVDKEQPQGNYDVEFDGVELTSGIYFYRLRSGDFVETRKMILIK